MKELLKACNKLGLNFNSTFRGYVSKFPLENAKFVHVPPLKTEFQAFDQILSKHPIHCELEIINNRFLFVKFSNETHGGNYHKLLNAQNIHNANKNLVGHGFEKMYALNDPTEKAIALNFIKDFGKTAKPSNISLKNFDINFQDINKIENTPELFYSAHIQGTVVEKLSQDNNINQQIYEGHIAPLKKNIKGATADTFYENAFQHHKNLSVDKTNTVQQQSQHVDVMDRMDYFKLIKKVFLPPDT